MRRPAPRTLLPFDHPDYQHPCGKDVRAVYVLLQMTEETLAGMVGYKSARAVRRWIAQPGAKSRARIEYAPWRLMLEAAGLVEPIKPLWWLNTNRS